MRFGVGAVAALPLLPLATAVKDWMFRNCEQNPFCARNRVYAETSRDSNFESPYTVVEVDTADPTNIKGVLAKKDRTTQFPFSLEVTTDRIVHLVVDEAGREDILKQIPEAKGLNPQRFSPAPFVLDVTKEGLRSPTIPPRVKKSKESLIVSFGDGIEVELIYSPFLVKIMRHGKEQIVLNKRKALNIEELRVPPEDLESVPEQVKLAWTDTFDQHTDKKIRGPEAVALDTTFEGFTNVYGIPEHSDSLALRDTRHDHTDPYRLFNVDIFEYNTGSTMPMYGSIPLMVAHRPGASAAIFWMNAADTYVDVDKYTDKSSVSAHWISETGKLDIYAILGEHPSDILQEYSKLTGTADLPQLFATAYHQCRWNYNSRGDLLDVNHQFDVHDIPLDVLWLDIEYTAGRKYFTWNDNFPEPEQMMNELDKEGRKLVTLIDPHIKVENGYDVYESLRDNDVVIHNVDGSQFEGHCWPGNSVWIDTLNPESWKWWSKYYGRSQALGGDSPNLFIWNDMSEPSVFSGSETTAYKDLRHYGGWEHRDVHNLYGQTVTNATYSALLDRYSDSQQRPFILTRSFFAGSQRLAAMWTGDNQAEWPYLKEATATILTLGMTGMPFAGADVGGFFRDPSPELLTRWYQSGAFYPFFRAHAHIDSKRREPYLFQPPYNTSMAEALELRYQLLPEFYTAFWESSQTLAPVMRPLFWEFPGDETLSAVDDQFMIGSSLMAKPVTAEGVTSVTVLAPNADDGQLWYNYFSGQPFTGGEVTVAIDTIPLYAKGGSVVFRKDRKRRSAELMALDPYTVLVSVDGSGRASGKLYVDDGKSIAADYLLTEVVMDNGTLRGTPVHKPHAKAISELKIERIIIYGVPSADSAVIADSGANIDILPQEHGLILRNPGVSVADEWAIHIS